MPIYEFECEKCGYIFECLLKIGESFPPCPNCQSEEVIKLPSLFGYKDNINYKAERERAILRRVKDYLIDGKIKDAQRFLKKAEEYLPTGKIKRLSDKLAEKKPPSGGFIIKPEVAILKKKG